MGRKYDEHSLNRPDTLVVYKPNGKNWENSCFKLGSFFHVLLDCLKRYFTQSVLDLKVLRGYRYATFGEPEPKISHANFFSWNN